MAEISEWLNICVDCGNRVTTYGSGLPGQCPSCKGWRWSCHWQNKTPEKKGLDPSEPPKDTGAGDCHPINDALSANSKGDKLISPVQKVDDLIKTLAGQGLGCKAIERKLIEQGVVISYRTIARRLQTSFVNL